jgi:DNA-binding response OmpR family regulator
MPQAVLVVDDDLTMLEILQAVLRSEGMTVHTAHDLDEALTVLATTPVALVLTDALAPSWAAGALGAIRQLIKAAGTTPVVLLTGHGEAANLDPTSVGLAAVLLKPFELDDLLACVHTIGRAADKAWD